MQLPPPLQRFTDAYARVIRPATATAALALLLAALVVGVHIARAGTWSLRVAALAIIAFAALVWLARWLWVRRQFASEAQAIRSVLVSTQPGAGGRVLRAHRLSQRSESRSGESQELRLLHYERMLKLASIEAVEEAAKQRSQVFRRSATFLFLGAALGLGLAPIHALEGLNVLLARDGVAPLEMTWLQSPQVAATTPRYLGSQKAQLMLESASLLPEGTEVTFRGRPRFRGRQIVLLDGENEVPFVDDGTGAVKAHWEVDRSSTLRIAARFGDVLVYQPQSLELHSQPDLPPTVKLSGAPASYELSNLVKLELRWSAFDDYSLVQVELVLRSAGREERRPLERYPGDKRSGSGGHVLYPDDPFFQRLFLPATITVEARDNDPLRGNKWGRSAAITVRPPTVGSPEAQRYSALSEMRDAWVKILVRRLRLDELPRAEQSAAHRSLVSDMAELQRASIESLRRSYGGLAPARGLVAFGQGQLERLRRAFQRRHEEVQTAEDVVLALDRALSSLSDRDAREVAKQLSDVAEEAAQAARLAQSSEDRASSMARLDLAIGVLNLGAAELVKLGLLGQDVGTVAQSDLDRLKRSRAREDLFHSELVALHMAARLRRPNPSFGSKGGGGGGVEAGPGMGGGSGTDAQGQSSQAESEFDRLAQDLEQLVSEHADSVGRTGAALDGAEEAVSADELEEEAKRRATDLRNSVLRLPQPGEAPGSSRAAAALAREHAGTMAHELTRLSFDDAVTSGQRAIAAAEDALRSGDLPSGMTRGLEDALSQLREHTEWAEQQRQRLQQLSEQAAKQALQDIAGYESELSERARRMMQESSQKVPLPEATRERLREAQSLMEEAASRLQQGRGNDGLKMQRRAQALLEEAQTGKTDGEGGDDGGQQQARGERPGDGRPNPGGGDVPQAEEKNGAEDFRKRVLEGLSSGAGGKLSPAVQRYAEGLLR